GERRFFSDWTAAKTDVLLSILGRAKASGFTVLVVTLGAMLLSCRPHDLANSYIPFAHGVGVQVGRTTPSLEATRPRAAPQDAHGVPVRLVRAGPPRGRGRRGGARRRVPRHRVVEGVQPGLVPHASCAFCVRTGRGIQSAQDAETALQGIMRSEKVKAAQAAGVLTVPFDSGVRTGPTSSRRAGRRALFTLLLICRAVGRPWLYGGIVSRQAGIEQVWRAILADLDGMLGLSGFVSLAEIQGMCDEHTVHVQFCMYYKKERVRG
ncbi:hypothetical protein DFH07DRAFT_753552, partial [Mycena maculata]